MYPTAVMQPLGINPATGGGRARFMGPNRRRRVRHPIHVPAYATLHRQISRSALELCVILDLSENGVAIQSAFPLEIGSTKDLSLDLSQSEELIQTSGTVVWSHASGRTGIRFTGMDADSLGALQQWLLANETSASTYDVSEDLSDAEIPVSRARASVEQPPSRTDFTSLLIGLAAVKKEVEALRSDFDAALHLIARRALTFSGASGAAIGLSNGSEMICRATAGQDAPPLGAVIHVGSGLSGECVRTGAILRCDDSESDPRVDRESCRALAIRSIVAVPIRLDGVVRGLLEVFSPRVQAFRDDNEAVLQRLAEIVSYAVSRSEKVVATPSPVPATSIDDEFPIESSADLPLPQISQSRNLVLGSAAITLVFAVVWIVGTWNSQPSVVANSRQATAKPVSQVRLSVPATLDSLRKLAEQGDSAAQFALGAHYAAGEDVTQDYSQAFRWFSLAAEQGHVPAQSALGGFYWAGRGVPVDLSKAYYWSLLAEAGGDDGSKQRVALLASRLNRVQVLAAQQQADEWLRQHSASR